MNDNNTILPKKSNSSVDSTILVDFSSSGRKRPWSKCKKQSLAVSNAYRLLDGLERYGDKIASCGCRLHFAACPSNHMRKLVGAHFCRCRLCSMCQWRKSLVIFHQLLQLIHAHKAERPTDVPLLLTLTVPNVKAHQLSEALVKLLRWFNKLMQRKRIVGVVKSYFRALEITYNRIRNDFHPHFHVLLMVPKAYFDKVRNLYISQNEWLNLWREITEIGELTQVDVRTIKKRFHGQSLEGICAETAKYTTKPSDYLDELSNGDFIAKPKVIEVLHDALFKKRLLGFGGLFKTLRKQLKQPDVEEADLIEITSEEKECVCPVCSSTLQEELYRWHVGLREYVR